VRLEGLPNKARRSKQRIERLGASFMGTLLSLRARFLRKIRLVVKPIRHNPESPIPIPETPSICHSHEQRSVDRRDARQ
jgi:hypothetical protein